MKNRRAWFSFPVAGLVCGLVLLLAWVSREKISVVEVGGPAPSFTAFDLQGNPRALEDYRGRVVLLNIWATWCAPCKEEMPSIQRLHDEVDDGDFLVLAVSIDRAPAGDDPADPLGGRLRAFSDSLGLTFTLLHDPGAEISTLYRTVGVPESFVLDREGVIVKKVTGPLEWDAPSNVELIRRVLRGSPDTSG
jgi:peroxiredoxin